MNSGQKFPDYVVLWNVGAGVAYVLSSGLTLVSCLEHFSGIQSSSLINPETTFAQEFALSIIALLLSIAVCVLNLIYAQYYFRHKDSRVPIGFVATIGFLVLVGFQLCRSISGIATYYNKNQFGAVDGVIKLLDVAILGTIAFDVINAVIGALAFWHVFRNGEIARTLYVQQNGVVTEDNGIAAEASDHAMGHPKPTPEAMEEAKSKNVPNQEYNDPIDNPLEERKKKEAEEKADRMKSKKKELPPILSADPNNDMLGKINREDHVLKIGKPTFAEAEGAHSDEEYHPREPIYKDAKPEPEPKPEPKPEPVHESEPKKKEEKSYEKEDTLPVDDEENVLPVDRSDD